MLHVKHLRMNSYRLFSLVSGEAMAAHDNEALRRELLRREIFPDAAAHPAQAAQ